MYGEVERVDERSWSDAGCRSAGAGCVCGPEGLDVIAGIFLDDRGGQIKRNIVSVTIDCQRLIEGDDRRCDVTWAYRSISKNRFK